MHNAAAGAHSPPLDYCKTPLVSLAGATTRESPASLNLAKVLRSICVFHDLNQIEAAKKLGISDSAARASRASLERR